MSVERLRASFGVEFGHSFRRPLFIAFALILLLTMFGLSSGKMTISSGDSSVGGTKAWITSEFAQTQTMTYLVLLYYAFFVAGVAGLSLLRDRELKVDALLHSTPLTPGEYVWGRFLAVVLGFGVMLLWQAASSVFFNHVFQRADTQELRGPLVAANYLMPALTMGLPFVVFYAGVSMYVGERTRSPVMVFVLPVLVLLVCAFFLWTWSPAWLDLRLNRLMQVLDPSGFRWLNESHLKVDRGVEFYNHQRVPYDGLFWVNRAWLLALGVGGVLLTRRSVALSARGAAVRVPRARKRSAPVAAPAWDEASAGTAVRALGMTGAVPSFFSGAGAVARAELRELLRQAGIYIFVPLILIQCLGNALLAVGAFDTRLLLTPGITALQAAGQTSVFVLFLLMFYTVEALERERATGLAPILYATPLRTAAFLTGKAAANCVIALAVLLGSFVGCAIAILIQHTVPLSLGPYLLIWGLLLIPTFVAWTAFVTACYAVTGNRYGAYSLSFALLAFTGFRALTGGINWAGNWALWGAMRWSDIGFFEIDRHVLILNRVMVLGFAVLFTVVAVRLFARRGPDAVRTIHRLAARRLASSGLKLAPYAAVPAVCAVALLLQVSHGIEGGAAKKAKQDYWAKNLKTWYGAPLPDIARFAVEVKVDPSRHWLSSAGTLTLVNPLDSTMAQIPLTGGLYWRNLSWTMNESDYEPEEDQHLYVFTPPRPLAKGDSVVIGWKFDGRLPGGVTRNGGNTEEFILPSGVVLTGFTPSFSPVIGFMEQVGETKKNTTEPRRYPRDYYRGITRGGYGATAWFPARVVVTGPEDYTLNSVGVCTSNTVTDGWRTQVWETDHPVKILNIICGRWDVKQGAASTVFYHPSHTYNVDEMSATLDAARRWYSEWFLPYPWRELKLSEFPGLAGYAQGFGTNITFSENIGFLTKNDPKTNATFMVTAHEAAHQWWGNILTPANGPNGEFLSEGASHFATMLLFEKIHGPRGRMEFAKGIEARYGNNRHADDERPMYDVDGRRKYDTTVIYDRGGWVFWMVYDYLGHDRALAGYRDFFQSWSHSRDHPALQDFVAAMRKYAPDPEAYDAFAQQWFEDKALPEYRITAAESRANGEGFEVTVTVENHGTGVMPVEVAATAGERWQKPQAGAPDAAYQPDPEYQDARGTVTLGAGESKTLTIHCGFKPERVVIDPDVRVLQLQRKLAIATL